MSSVPDLSVPTNPATSAPTPAVPTTAVPATSAPPVNPTTAPSPTPTTAPPATTPPATTPPAETPPTSSPAETPATTPPAATPTTAPPATVTSRPTTAQETVVITTSNDGSTIILTSTSIATPTTNTGAPPGVSTSASSSNSFLGADASSAPNTSSGGLTGTTKIVVAVVVPIIGVALIAIVLLFLWKKRRRDKENSEMRRKEVEDYGYNPNSAPVAAVGGASSNGDELPYEMAENTVGYRGWGSTRKALNVGSMPLSVGTSQPLSPVFPENVHHQDNYGFATSPTTSTYPGGTAPSDGGMSNAPLITTPPGYRPETADSSVVAAMTGPQTSNNPGIRRGISNASSNYSVQSTSDQSDVGMPPVPYDPHYYAADGGYEDAHNHSARFDNGQDYAQYPPVIREVQARRNTQIETPTDTHFPQQGNSGIAQNF